MNDVAAIVAEAVGENIDALLTLDLRGYHLGRILYRAARASAGEPLVLAAARKLVDRVGPGDRALLLTGFPFLPYGRPELDGLVGTAAVARALDLARDARPVVVTDAVTVPVMRALLTTAGLVVVDDAAELRSAHTAVVVPFTLDEGRADADAVDLLDAYAPSCLVAIEKPGANAGGRYHQGNGLDVTHLVAKTDALMVRARERGVTTIAVGDLGNELGMAGLATVLDEETPFGSRFVRTPAGSVAAAVAADHVVVASVSDWGGYGLAAMIAYLCDAPDALHSATLQRHLLWTAVRAGALDGTGRGEPAVDGVGEEYTARLVDLLHDVIALTRDASRRYAAIVERTVTLRRSP